MLNVIANIVLRRRHHCGQPFKSGRYARNGVFKPRYAAVSHPAENVCYIVHGCFQTVNDIVPFFLECIELLFQRVFLRFQTVYDRVELLIGLVVGKILVRIVKGFLCRQNVPLIGHPFPLPRCGIVVADCSLCLRRNEILCGFFNGKLLFKKLVRFFLRFPLLFQFVNLVINRVCLLLDFLFGMTNVPVYPFFQLRQEVFGRATAAAAAAAFLRA